MLKTDNFPSRAQVRFLCALFLLLIVSSIAVSQSTAAKPVPTSPGTSSSTATVSDAKATQTVVDPTVPGDPVVLKMLEPYSGKVRALDVVIGELDGELKKGGLGAGTLGNFVADGMRTRASQMLKHPIDLAITNSGGLRKSAFTPGEMRVVDIFELLPFENALVEVELTGEQLLKVLAVATNEPQSGARVVYRSHPDKTTEFVSATLIDANGKEHSVDTAAKYRVVTVDYLLSVGGRFSILQQAATKNPLGTTIRDALIAYVKGETAAGRKLKGRLDGRFREAM